MVSGLLAPPSIDRPRAIALAGAAVIPRKGNDMNDRTALRTRITSRITVEDRGFRTACWISNRAMHSNGYTKIGYFGQTWLTHRFAYTVFVGDIPDGLQLDHLCSQRACCNPEHLEPVTCRENLLRGDTLTAREAAQTHCKEGHPLSGPNLYVRPDRVNSRGCRTCRRNADRRAKRRRSEAA